jgi:hypothetical protein
VVAQRQAWWLYVRLTVTAPHPAWRARLPRGSAAASPQQQQARWSPLPWWFLPGGHRARRCAGGRDRQAYAQRRVLPNHLLTSHQLDCHSAMALIYV